MTFNDELEDWDALSDLRATHPVILLGNGASRAVWDRFDYSSLYDLACKAERPHHLTVEDRAFFREMEDTKNFELVLSSLAIARKVNETLCQSADLIIERYNSIRMSLIQAVRDIHVPFQDVPLLTKRSIADELSNYRQIFTTNYDLLVYWSFMGADRRWKDFFWGENNSFDPGDCEVWGEPITVYYLHGALHLYRTLGGETRKLVANEAAGGVLAQFDTHPMHVPVFISEGTARDKKSAILRNDYLSFAYRAFAQNKRSLVVFGQSLNPEHDNHLIEAIGRMRCQHVAISVFTPTPGHDVIGLKGRLSKAWPNKNIRFFKSTTHPLGTDDLRLATDS